MGVVDPSPLLQTRAPSTPRKTLSKRNQIIIALVAFAVVAAIVIGVAVGVSQKKHKKANEDQTAAENALNDGIQWPAGTYQVNADDLTEDASLLLLPMPMSGNMTPTLEAGRPAPMMISFTNTGPSSGSTVMAGVRFGISGPINVIPSSSIGGNTLNYSLIIPTGICANLDSICHQVKCYEFAVTAAGKVSKANINQMALICGDCNEPSCKGLVNCQPCNAEQVAGADTPESRRIDLGKSSGSFVFDWNTYTQQDQILIWYEGNVIFDSGCIGSYGSPSVSFGGTSTEIRVDVIPNCAGGSGTAWDFTVNCPLR